MLLLYLPLYLVAFFLIERIEADHYIIYCALDRFIPFNEYFIIPYAFWYLWFPGVPLVFAYVALKPYLRQREQGVRHYGDTPGTGFCKSRSCETYLHNGVPYEARHSESEAGTLGLAGNELSEAALAKADFIKTCIVMFTSMTISLIIYVVWPNGVDLREPIESANICAWLVELIRQADTPYGVCPSIHICTIVAEMLVIKDSRLKMMTPAVKTASFIITLLIAWSTMALKQHSIVDVISGAALAAALYYLESAVKRMYMSKKA